MLGDLDKKRAKICQDLVIFEKTRSSQNFTYVQIFSNDARKLKFGLEVPTYDL